METNYLEMLQKLGTPETFTAIGVLAAGWVGWKVAGNALSVVGSFASKASFAGLAATILALAGMSTAGFGVGEIATRNDEPSISVPKAIVPGVQNIELEAFAKTFNGHSNPELAKLFMDYARERDGLAQRMSDELIQDILTKTTEHNKEASVELIKLFRAREERRHVDGMQEDPKSLVRSTASNPTLPMLLTSMKSDDSFESKLIGKAPEKIEQKESTVSLPVAYSMLFGGIASTIGGCVVGWRLRRTEDQVTANKKFA